MKSILIWCAVYIIASTLGSVIAMSIYISHPSGMIIEGITTDLFFINLLSPLYAIYLFPIVLFDMGLNIIKYKPVLFLSAPLGTMLIIISIYMHIIKIKYKNLLISIFGIGVMLNNFFLIGFGFSFGGP